MSYHNGSVWPHDNALIAAGFARYGRREDTARVFESLFSASTYVDLRRLTELFWFHAPAEPRTDLQSPAALRPVRRLTEVSRFAAAPMIFAVL